MAENESLQERLDRIKQLNRGRFDFVLARSKTPQPTIAEACRAAGRAESWFYRLPDDEKAEMEKLAEELHKAEAVQARLTIDRALPHAAEVMAELVDHRDPQIKIKAAADLMDRGGLKPTQKTENQNTTTLVMPGLLELIAKVYGNNGGHPGA